MTSLRSLLHISLLVLLCAVVTVFGLGMTDPKPPALPPHTPGDGDQSLCLTPLEMDLYRQLNAYRKQKGLPAIPLSYHLSLVAKTHAADIVENHPDEDEECNMHSWSDKGEWTACCYTRDHARSDCMWSKPTEISGGAYTGTGYEIAYMYSDAIESAQLPMNSWKSSPGHHNVMVNASVWKDYKWKAVGVGIYEGFACIWFSDQADSKTVAGCE